MGDEVCMSKSQSDILRLLKPALDSPLAASSNEFKEQLAELIHKCYDSLFDEAAWHREELSGEASNNEGDSDCSDDYVVEGLDFSKVNDVLKRTKETAAHIDDKEKEEKLKEEISALHPSYEFRGGQCVEDLEDILRGLEKFVETEKD